MVKFTHNCSSFLYLYFDTLWYLISFKDMISTGPVLLLFPDPDYILTVICEKYVSALRKNIEDKSLGMYNLLEDYLHHEQMLL